MAISEKITLLGKGLYKDIPDVLTLKSIPTASELDYVGGEDFQTTMLDNIFPKAIEEQVDFRQLLEIDFQWICRCLRILNYGPYFTTNTLFCAECGTISGEFRVDLRAVEVKTLPNGFTNAITISKDEFIEFDKDITLKLPTVQDMMNAAKDPLFKDANGDTNIQLARICYMISAVGNNTHLTTVEAKSLIQNHLISADFLLLKSMVNELTDYGLRAGGRTLCPRCNNSEAAFVALVDDRFFRPTLGDLRAWKADRASQKSSGSTNGNGESGQRMENIPSNATAKV